MNQLTLNELTEGFWVDLKIRNRSPATIRSYRWYLAKFLAFLDAENIRYPDQVSGEILHQYQLSLIIGQGKTGKKGAAFANPYLMPVRSFLNFLRKSGHFYDDPLKALSPGKQRRKLPKQVLSREEIITLIEKPDTTTILGYRDRTIMELLYSTAIRRNELRDLKVFSVNLEDRLIRVFGKGQKERFVPVGRIAAKFLDVYLKSVRPLLVKPVQRSLGEVGNKSEDHLFLSISGRKLSRNVVGELISKYTRLARIKKRVTPHTFRHTCATLMLRNGADIRYIQMLLGHESLESTQIYTHVAVTDLRRILEKHHPREAKIDPNP